ncbi:MAG: GIY-YIG nuclease family protein [Desulfurococcaceae archaeon]
MVNTHRWSCYVLILEVENPVEATTMKKLFRVEPGVYFYVGSSRKPHSALARIARHLSRFKKTRWHIDALTTSRSTRVKGVILISSENERLDCESAIARLLLKAEYSYVPGFGCSDKQRDLSHLFRCGKTDAVMCAEELYSLLEEAGFNAVYAEVDS